MASCSFLGFVQESVCDNFNILKVKKEHDHCVSNDGSQIKEGNYVHDHKEDKEESEGCGSDGRSSDYTNEFSPSGFFVGRIRKRRRFEQVQSGSNSDDYTNVFSPSGFFVGQKIRAKKRMDDGDAKSESSVGFNGDDNDVCDDATSDVKELKSNSDDYTNVFSPSGFFLYQKIRAKKTKTDDGDAKSESSVNGHDNDTCDDADSEKSETVKDKSR